MKEETDTMKYARLHDLTRTLVLKSLFNNNSIKEEIYRNQSKDLTFYDFKIMIFIGLLV